MNNYISEADSNRFGFKVVRINQFNDSVPKIIEQFRAIEVKMIISRVPAENVQLINEMEQADFRLKDIQLTYSFDIGRGIIPIKTKDNYIYRDFKPNDIKDIVDISFQSFKNYGHYSRINFPCPIDTGEIYADWAERCCQVEKQADKIIVAIEENKVAGFLALMIRKKGGLNLAVGVIGAVGKKHRNRGVFRSINIESLLWAKQKGLDSVENNVLLDNYPVNKTYSSLGFNIVNGEVTFHCFL
jgi:hypothetical protein